MSEPVIKTAQDFKDARHELGMTAKQAARACCTTEKNIYKWEAPPECATSRQAPELARRVLEEMSNGWRPSWL